MHDKKRSAVFFAVAGSVIVSCVLFISAFALSSRMGSFLPGDILSRVTSLFSSQPALLATLYPSSLKSYFPFNESVGTTTQDAALLTRRGTIYGNPTRDNSLYSNSIYFDGVDDYVDVGQTPELNGSTEMTVSAWVKVDRTPAGTYEVFQRGYSSSVTGAVYFGVSGFSTGDYSVYFDVQEQGSGKHIVASAPFTWRLKGGEWQHIVGVARATRVDVYVGGALAASVPYSGMYPLMTSGTTFSRKTYIGARVQGTSSLARRMKGSIDEVRVYNRALSVSEILALKAHNPTLDQRAPVISRESPIGKIENGLSRTWLSVRTDIAAACAYSENSATSFANSISMVRINDTVSSVYLFDLVPNTTKNYYVRCVSASGVESSPFTFTLQTGSAFANPRTLPTGGESLATISAKFDSVYNQLAPTGVYTAYNNPYHAAVPLYSLAHMYEATANVKYIQQALGNMEYMMGKAVDIDGNGFLVWINNTPVQQSTLWDHDRNANTPLRIGCKEHERAAFGFTKIARIIKQTPALQATYGARADAAVAFVKKNVLGDPWCAYTKVPGFSTAHDTIVHILNTLMNLYAIEGDLVMTNGYRYSEVFLSHARLARQKMFPSDTHPRAFVWNSTGCSNIVNTCANARYNVSSETPEHIGGCQDSFGRLECHPIDFSHGEFMVQTAIELYRMGFVFTREDIDALRYTFRDVIWNGDSTIPKFASFVDGGLLASDSVWNKAPTYEWSSGGYLAGGWTELAGFDSGELVTIIEKSMNSSGSYITTWGLNRLPMYASLARAKTLGDKTYAEKNTQTPPPPPPPPPPAPFCGDLSCNGTETCSTCAGDCGACPIVTPPPPSTGTCTTLQCLDASLIAHYPFDEGFGSLTVDRSGQNEVGVLNGNVSWIDGIIGKALRFNATPAYVEVATSTPFHGLQNITISTWFYLSGTSTNQEIMHRASSRYIDGYFYLFYQSNINSITFDIEDVTTEGHVYVYSPKITNPGAWHHLVAVVDGTTARVYVDGVAGPTKTFGGLFPLTSNNRNNFRHLFFGSRFYETTVPTQPLTGGLDDVRFYNRPLSVSEITLLYTSRPETPVVVPPPAPVEPQPEPVAPPVTPVEPPPAPQTPPIDVVITPGIEIPITPPVEEPVIVQPVVVSTPTSGGGGGGGSIAISPSAPQESQSGVTTPTTPVAGDVTSAPQSSPATVMENGTTVSTYKPVVFERNLAAGDSGSDVRALQTFLYERQLLTQAPSGLYDVATILAVSNFQKQQRLTSSSGVFDTATRMAVNTIAQQAKETPTIFTVPISFGQRSDEVMKLHRLLVAEGFLSEATGYFGGLTQKAVGSFQEKYQVATPGSDGYGLVGPKTRAALNVRWAALFGAASSTSSTVPAVVVPAQTVGGTITQYLLRGSRHAEVVVMQRILIKNGFLEAGNDTGFFGPLSQTALQNFQASQNIVSSGTPSTTGFGVTGPKTRAALNSVR